jgi:hypothetical protein
MMKDWIRNFFIGLGRWCFAAYAVTVLSGLAVDLAGSANFLAELWERLVIFALISPVFIIMAAVPANLVLTGLQRFGLKSLLLSIVVSFIAGGIVMLWGLPISPFIVIGAVAGAAGGVLRDWPCTLFSRSTVIIIAICTAMSLTGVAAVPDAVLW